MVRLGSDGSCGTNGQGKVRDRLDWQLWIGMVGSVRRGMLVSGSADATGALWMGLVGMGLVGLGLMRQIRRGLMGSG